MTVALIRYDAARKALAAASRVDEAKKIRDRAEAVRVYAQQARDFELQNRAAAIRLLAERRAGQLLLDMAKNPGTRGEGRPRRDGSRVRQSSRTTAYPPRLDDLGISRDQSSKWQRLARLVDDSTFEEAINRAKEEFGELTTRGVLSMLKEVVRPKSTKTEYSINEVADDLTREIERRHQRLNVVVEAKEHLNPTLRRKLITALEHEASMAQKLLSGFQDFENSGKAFQRIVRERLAQLPEPDIKEKKRLASSLKNATIREISYKDARGLILQNEWMASVGSAEFFFGLYFGKYLGGVVAFGSTGGTNVASSVCGAEHRDEVISLIRGCTCHWSHEHSGSYLVARACREMEKKGYRVIVAFSDREAGEQGVIFKACNFLFCGTTGATEKFRKPDGRIRDARLVSGYTRDRTGGTLKYRRSRAAQKQMMLDQGVEFFRGTPKLRWVLFVGDRRTKRILRQALRWEVKPYPNGAQSKQPQTARQKCPPGAVVWSNQESTT